MLTSRQKAEYFLENERAFRLGAMLTESSHPKTSKLSQVMQQSTEEGITLLSDVDREIPPVAEKVFASKEFASLTDAMYRACSSGKRIFFTGCGATGRLSILLEAAWRKFWQQLKINHSDLMNKVPDLENATFSVMAGGDHALIRSVEGFEDFTYFGKYQLAQGGVDKDDVVVAITEGGETSFVIGTAWKGLEVGAEVFFVYNNPSEVLREHVQRSREVIEEERITKLDLATGPMAVAGSTRMQATTSELLVVGTALELALVKILEEHLSSDEIAKLGIVSRKRSDYSQLFSNLVEQLRAPSVVESLAKLTRFEKSIYEHQGLITYMTDGFLLDVLTDTTERAPTFRLPPFRKCDDTLSARSWAFLKNPLYNTEKAWWEVMRRPLRGLDWTADTYRELEAPEILQKDPPPLNNDEIRKFQIGNEIDASRYEADDSALVMILVGDEVNAYSATDHPFQQKFREHAEFFNHTAAICIGPQSEDLPTKQLFQISCDLPVSPLGLWERLAVKLVLNTISTATMVSMGRVIGNWMAYVETTNKKLIDRGVRLVVELTGMEYDDACYALFEAIDEVAIQDKTTKDAPSPVALVIERVGLKE